MYSNILLPVPYSPETQLQKPLEVAQTLADEDAKIHLVHVMEVLPSYVTQYLPPNTVEITKGQMLTQMEEFAADLPNAQAIVLDGHAGRVLSDFAEENEVDLIVMSSHIPGAGDLLWGSTAGYVVRHVHCAVHVIR